MKRDIQSIDLATLDLVTGGCGAAAATPSTPNKFNVNVNLHEAVSPFYGVARDHLNINLHEAISPFGVHAQGPDAVVTVTGAPPPSHAAVQQNHDELAPEDAAPQVAAEDDLEAATHSDAGEEQEEVSMDDSDDDQGGHCGTHTAEPDDDAAPVAGMSQAEQAAQGTPDHVSMAEQAQADLAAQHDAPVLHAEAELAADAPPHLVCGTNTSEPTDDDADLHADAQVSQNAATMTAADLGSDDSYELHAEAELADQDTTLHAEAELADDDDVSLHADAEWADDSADAALDEQHGDVDMSDDQGGHAGNGDGSGHGDGTGGGHLDLGNLAEQVGQVVDDAVHGHLPNKDEVMADIREAMRG